jgi:hypothetical protein
MPGQASESGFHFLADYLRCQQYFYWKYPRALEPATKAPALIFGNNIHSALAAWYEAIKEGKDFDTKLASAQLAFRNGMEADRDQYMDTEKYDDDLIRGQILLQAYAVEYPMEPWEILEVEVPVEYTFPETGDKFTGRMDLVARANSRTYIVDHKTTGWSMSSLSRALGVSDQGTGYIWLWNVVHQNEPVDGIIFNILRSYKSSNEFRQALVMKTDEDIGRFKKESGFVLNEIAEKVSNPDAIWPRNTGACFLFNRPCQYLDLCFGSSYAEGLIGTAFVERQGKPEPDEPQT